ncbi:hypothetical protein BOTBODRAFT_35314 [Botryobasidium botryosum FD-172 SS1]|uniref:C2 domain-containing protein n=1 Tax=Botryobasidium botryosum (strain FD-172 SS1) TaxID=930990 RepID=A0A067M6N7_BOTB1|nr:hypothetical protein BOTBODRAFT_35314 [Botryobasidium botryosum FD-172 SS1]
MSLHSRKNSNHDSLFSTTSSEFASYDSGETMELTIIEAHALPKNRLKSKPKTYVTATVVGDNSTRSRTTVARRSSAPRWDQPLVLRGDSSSTIRIEVVEAGGAFGGERVIGSLETRYDELQRKQSSGFGDIIGHVTCNLDVAPHVRVPYDVQPTISLRISPPVPRNATSLGSQVSVWEE